MIGPVINALRVFKGLHDLSFSEDQFYVEQRAEFLKGIRYCVEQAKKGWRNPPEARTHIRKSFKLLLSALVLIFLLAIMFGGR